MSSYLHHPGRGRLHILPLDAAFFRKSVSILRSKQEKVGHYEGTVKLMIGSVIK